MLVLCTLTAFNLVGPGIFYVVFRIVIVSVLLNQSALVGIRSGVAEQFSNILNWSLIFVLFLQVVFGLGTSQPTLVRSMSVSGG